MMTFDAARNFVQDGASFVPAGKPLARPVRSRDGKMTYDSTGAFLVGELERLDPKMHEPLAAVFWGRDIDLREDVSIGDEVSSFALLNYGSPGALGSGNGVGTGKAWLSQNTTQITNVSVDIAKMPFFLHPWAMELKYTIFELESAATAGRPIDEMKLSGLQLKHQMDIDEQVYVGDTTLGDTGLFNKSSVTNLNTLANGAAGSPLWSNKTPAEILYDVNTALTSTWTASAYAKFPNRVMISPLAYSFISTQVVSAAGSISILKYLRENNIMTAEKGVDLDIFSSKWSAGVGAGGVLGTGGTGHDRMIVYSKDKDWVRFPMTSIQRTPLQFAGIYHFVSYYCRLGIVECVYPAGMSYWDALS
jgi:hypothetical protein